MGQTIKFRLSKKVRKTLEIFIAVFQHFDRPSMLVVRPCEEASTVPGTSVSFHQTGSRSVRRFFLAGQAGGDCVAAKARNASATKRGCDVTISLNPRVSMTSAARLQ